MIRSFNGRTPRVADSTFVSETAYVIGDVEIGENSSVWPGAVVRSDFASIRIGRNTHVEDSSVLHSGTPMEIGNSVLIGHGVIMHGREIGNNTLIGNNATILDNAEIGDFCIIAAGCLVEAMMKIPDQSFVVGVPGKIKGQVLPEQLRRLQEGPQTYSKLSRQYREQGL